MNLDLLSRFIVKAKAATYVGSGERSPSCRPGSHDLKFSEGAWSYLDSYFGGRDFIGEEVVYFEVKPAWAMNYYGRILQPELITPAQAGEVIKASLSELYQKDRFLGGWEYTHGPFTYVDKNEGDVSSFRGREYITFNGETTYELFYHGGMILDD